MSNSKWLSGIFLILIAATSYAQEFKIARPDVKKMQELEEAKEYPYSDEMIYEFLKTTYTPAGEMVYTHEGEIEFAFSQEFKDGLIYATKNSEDSGQTVTLKMPKADLESLRIFIQNINAITPMDIKNIWSEDKMKYHPEDEGAGCYYEIEQTATHTILKNYCGC